MDVERLWFAADHDSPCLAVLFCLVLRSLPTLKIDYKILSSSTCRGASCCAWVNALSPSLHAWEVPCREHPWLHMQEAILATVSQEKPRRLPSVKGED